MEPVDLSVRPESAISDEDVNRASAEAARREIAELIAKENPQKPKSKWFTPMSPIEKAAQAAFLGLGAVDWGQTVRFTQDPAYRQAGWYEQNKILGKHPSRAKVNILIPLGLAAHTLASWALPRPYRNILQVAGIASETDAVIHNDMKPTWPWGP